MRGASKITSKFSPGGGNSINNWLRRNPRLAGGVGAAAAVGAAGLIGYGIKKAKDFVSNLIKSRKKRKMEEQKTVPIEPSVIDNSTEVIPSQEVVPLLPATIPIADTTTTPVDDQNGPTLVPVKGNPKVMRCLNCKTFVSVNSPHTFDDCNARLAKKALHDTKSTSPRKRKSKKVDKNFVKSFRKLEKENTKNVQLKNTIGKKASTLIKKYKTQKTTKIPKQMLSFLDFITKRFH